MALSELTDEDILIRLKELKKSDDFFNDAAKMYSGAIYDRYYKKGYNLCRYWGLYHNDAEDVMQDSFVRLFNYVQTYKAGRPFKRWFLKIVLNQVRAKYNERKRRNLNDLDSITDLPEPGENNNIEKFQIRAYLNGIIEKAPEKLKEVMLLHVNYDLTYDEIAETVGISSRQVRNRLGQAYAYVKLHAGSNYDE